MKELWDRFVFWLSIRFGMTGRGLSIFFVSLLVLMLAAVLLPGSCSALNLDLTYSAGADVFGNNEPVVGDKVARYQGKVGLVAEYKWLTANPEVTVWGVNTWEPSATRDETNWSVEEWRSSLNLQLDFGPENLRLFSEFYTPFGGWSRKGAGSFESYWWLVGIRGKINLFER